MHFFNSYLLIYLSPPLDYHVPEGSGGEHVSNIDSGSKVGEMNEWSFLHLLVSMSFTKCLGNDWGWGEGMGEGAESSAARSTDSRVQMAGFESPPLPLFSCMTLGKLLILLGPQLYHLLNGDNNSFCLLELL